MRTSIKTLDNNQIEITVIFEGAQWHDICNETLRDLASDVEIEGYPKGQAPLHAIRSQLGMNLYYQAANNLLNLHIATITAKANAPIASISADIKRVTDDFIEIVLTCDKEPEITLTKYTDLPVERPSVPEVSDDDINEKLKEMQNEYAYYEVKNDGEVAMGDSTLIDFDGYKDGVAFEGGHATNFDLTIGSHRFIPGFEEAMVGMKTGETKDIPLTFPDNYPAENLAGADVIFKVRVNEIKVKCLPDIDDELALDADIDGVETLDELKAYLKQSLVDERSTKADELFTDNIITALIDYNPFDVEDSIINNQTEQLVGNFQSQLYQQGLSLSQYLQMSGMTPEQFKDAFKQQALREAKQSILLQAIARKEGLTVTDEQVDDAILSLASEHGMTLEDFKQIVGDSLQGYKDNLRQSLLFEQSLRFVKDHVSINN